MQKPKTLSSEIVYENPRFRIRKDSLLWPDGTPSEFYLTEHPPYVVLIAERDRELLVVEQYRYQTDSITIELPAGILNPAETPEEAARRELLEETGYAAKDVTHLASFHAFGRIRGHVLRACRLTRLQQPKLEASEFNLTSRWIKLDEWRELLANDRVTMYATLAAWALYEAKRRAKPL